jgi:hypothetical protein
MLKYSQRTQVFVTLYFTLYISYKTTFSIFFYCDVISKRILIMFAPEEAQIFKDYLFILTWFSVTLPLFSYLSQVTDKLYHIMLYTSPWSRFKLTTSVVIGTECNYHTTTVATGPCLILIKQLKIWYIRLDNCRAVTSVSAHLHSGFDYGS